MTLTATPVQVREAVSFPADPLGSGGPGRGGLRRHGRLGARRPRASAGTSLVLSLLVVRTATDVASLGAIGALVLTLCQRGGAASPAGAGLARSASTWAGIWTLLLAATLVAEVLAPSTAVAHGSLGPDESDLVLRVRWLVAGVVLAAATRVLARATRGSRDTVIVLVVAVSGLVPATVTGHGGTSSEGWLSTVALLVHVITVCAWVGGLLALVMHARALWSAGVGADTVRSFSRVALVGYVGVAGSGVVTALAQSDVAQLLNSRAHGTILLAKIGVLVLLGIAGAAQRLVILPRLSTRGPAALALVAASELILMASALGLAVTLTHTAS